MEQKYSKYETAIFTCKLFMGSSNTSTASFEANIDFLFDYSLGYIIDWRIHFTKVTIDCLATESWSLEKNPKHSFYLKRGEDFKRLFNKEQHIRINKSFHELFKLNDKQLESISESFNSKNYKSTIYNIVTWFKGSNPSGANKNPKSAQIWTFLNNKKYNLHIFLHNFIAKNDVFSRNNKEENQKAWESAKRNNYIYDLEDYLLFFPKIKKICDSFQISHSDKGAIKNAKRHARILMEKITKVEEDAKSECQKYVKEFTDHYKTMEKSSSEIFGFSDSSSLCLEKAHILPRSFIKKEMLEKYDNIEEYLKIKEQISDIYNILPLDANTHKLYDSYEIYWNQSGELVSKENVKYHYLKNYQKILPKELEPRIKYLKLYIDKILSKNKILS